MAADHETSAGMEPAFDQSLALKAAIAGLCTMAAVMGIGRFVYTPILPFMVEDGAISIAEGGTLASANFIGYLVGAIAASSSRITGNRANWLYAAFLASIATTALMALDGPLLWYYLVRLISGIASAFGMIFVSAIVFETIKKAGLNGLRAVHFAGVGIGISLSSIAILGSGSSVGEPSLAGAMGANWQAMWLVSAAVAVLALPVMWIWLGERPGSGKVLSQAGSLSARLVEPKLPGRYHLLVVSYGLFGFGYVISATFISSLARLEPALSSMAGLVWPIVGLSIIPSIWLWNRFADRFGLIAAYIGGSLLLGLGVALSVLVLEPWAIALSAILIGGTFVAATAIGLALAQEHVVAAAALQKERAGASVDPRRAIGIMTAAFGLGQVIGPSVAGWLYSIHGNFLLASLLAVVALLLTALIAWFARTPSTVS